jgi:multicomponent Na+:H+ antiporter subunit B
MIAVAAIVLSDLFAVVMLFGVYSLLTAALFMNLDAVDVAFTEAAVGAGVTTVLMLSSLHLTKRWEAMPRRNPLLGLLVVGITGAALLYAVQDAPLLGDPEAPVHQHVTPRYIEQGEAEVGMPNLVTAVLASYRGYDTFGETVVIFTAGLAVLLLLGIKDDPRLRPGMSAIGDQVVLRLVVKALLPLILLFGLYVQFHGDFGAGGGFQAGVIFATALVLYDLVFGECRRLLAAGWPALPGLLGAGARSGSWSASGGTAGGTRRRYHGVLGCAVDLLCLLRPEPPPMSFLPGIFNYLIVVFLMMAGFYVVIAQGNLVKKLVGLGLFQASVFILYITMGHHHGQSLGWPGAHRCEGRDGLLQSAATRADSHGHRGRCGHYRGRAGPGGANP